LDQDVSRATTDASVEVLDYLNRTTLDIIGQVAFALEVDSLTNPKVPLRQAYSRMFAFDLMSCLSQAVAMYLPWTRRIPTRMNRDTARSAKTIADTASHIVLSKLDEDEESSTPMSKDILSSIVRQNQGLAKHDSDKLSFEELRDQVMNFLGAGHDTTATGVAWTIDLLSKHVDVQEKLRGEIIASLPLLTQSDIDPHRGGYGLADLNLLDRLPYLANVCNESLRYIPPVPIVIRECVEDTTLSGYFIPKGTNIFISSNAINRLPWLWGPDANTFDPDRWSNLPKEWVPGAFQTFLEGPRGCIGRKFAETEMKVLLCCLLSHFKFERDESWPDQEEAKNWRIVLRPRDGIHVKVQLIEKKVGG
jgi:cytochrome P450